MKEKMLLTTLLIHVLLFSQGMAEVPNNYGYFLSKDVVAIKARRLFQLPSQPWYSLQDQWGASSLYNGNGLGIVSRDVVVNELGTGKVDYGTTDMSLALKSFPEVHRIYSFRATSNIFQNLAYNPDTWNDGGWNNAGSSNAYRRSRIIQNAFTFAKDTTGKWGAWRFRPEVNRFGLEPESIYNQAPSTNNYDDDEWTGELNGGQPNTIIGNFRRENVRAKYNSTTGDCSHDIKYIPPYLVFVCVNRVSFNDRFTSSMIYDYYIRIQDDVNPVTGGILENWWMSPQNWLNYSLYRDQTGKQLTAFGTPPQVNPTGLRNDVTGWVFDVDYNMRVKIGRVVLGDPNADPTPPTPPATPPASVAIDPTKKYTFVSGNSQTNNFAFALFWNAPFEGQLSDESRLPTRTVNRVVRGTSGDTSTASLAPINNPNTFFVRRVDNDAFTGSKKNANGQHAFNSQVLCKIGTNPTADTDPDRDYPGVGAILEMVQLKGSPNMMVTILNNAGGSEKEFVQVLECEWTGGSISYLTNNFAVDGNFKQTAGWCLGRCIPVTTFTPTGFTGLKGTSTSPADNFRIGSMKYVPAVVGKNGGFIVGINQDVADVNSGTADRFVTNQGTIFRCSYASTGQPAATRGMTNCVSSPQCPGPRNAFGYFSDCVTAESCGIYYMGRPEYKSYQRRFNSNGVAIASGEDTLYINNRYNQWRRLNRVYCADILKFYDSTVSTNAATSPLLYRRHFTGEGIASAHDVGQVISSGVDSEANSFNIESSPEVYVYNQELADPTDSIIPVWTPTSTTSCKFADIKDGTVYPLSASAVDYQQATQLDRFTDICLYGRVVRVSDFFPPEGNYPFSLYPNTQSVIPFGREGWKTNAPSPSLYTPTGSTWTSWNYNTNRVQVFNNETGISFYDQVPLGNYIVRVRRGISYANSRHLEVAKCRQTNAEIVNLNCSGYNDTSTATGQGRRILMSSTENIERVWYFNKSIVVLTQEAYNFSFNDERTNPGYTPNTGPGFPHNKATYQNGIPRHRLYSYIKSSGVWSMHDFGKYSTTNTSLREYSNGIVVGTLNQGLIDHIDVAEHECDLIIAYKLWTDLYITRPIIVIRAPGLYLANSATPTVGNNYTWWAGNVIRQFPEFEYYPIDHPYNINGRTGYSGRRFFPLEDDSCVTGLSIVQDISWRVRFLLDCTRGDNDPVHQNWGKTKWFGDYFIFDNSYVRKYKNIFNVTGSRYSRNKNNNVDLDVFGDQLEYGCATRQYVFVYSREFGAASTITSINTNVTALVAAVNVQTQSKLYFDLWSFGVGNVQKLWCVGDYVVGYGAATNSTGSTSALFVLYGTNILDARRRIHSVMRFANNITRISPTLVDDKIWISFNNNNAVDYRVIFVEGPIMVVNSTSTGNSAITLTQTNPFNTGTAGTTYNTTLNPTYPGWATQAKVNTAGTQDLGTTTTNINGLNVIEGPVYAIEPRGRNVGSITVKQRIRWLKNQYTIPVWNSTNTTWIGRGRTLSPFSYAFGSNAINNGWGDAQCTDNCYSIYELKIKGNRLMELIYDKGYTRVVYSDLAGDGADTFRLSYPVGLECRYLDFDVNADTSNNWFYWATVCQQSQYKEVRITRDTHTRAGNAALTASTASAVIIPNDQIDEIGLERVTDDVHLLTLYNKDEKILNISLYNFATGLGGNSNNNNDLYYENRMGAPMQTYMKTLASAWSTFSTKDYIGVVYSQVNSGNVWLRWIERRTTADENLFYPPYTIPSTNIPATWTTTNTAGLNARLQAIEGAHYALPVQMSRIDYIDCTGTEDAPVTNNNINCVFIGPDRTFYHYKFNKEADTTWEFKPYTFAAANTYQYYNFRDYQPRSVQITPNYIIAKARSYESADNTFLIWKRRDKGGTGYLWTGLNGTISGLNDIDFDRAQVQMTENNGGAYVWWIPREAQTAKVYKMYNLEATFGKPNSLYANCIGFTKDNQNFCYQTSNNTNTNIPNQVGTTAPVPSYNGTDFWWKLALWGLAFLVLLAALGLLLSMLGGNPKPGVYQRPPARRVQVVEEVVRKPRQRQIIEETVIKRNRHSTNRPLID